MASERTLLISNGGTYAELNTENGQLFSLMRGRVEVMWPGGAPAERRPAAGWQNSEIVMFPIVGAAPEDRFLVGSLGSFMNQHGLSRYMEWKDISSRSDRIEMKQVYRAGDVVKGKENKKGNHTKEPLMIVRPAVRRWGLDYLHVSLIILVIILIAFAFALSAFKPGPVYANCPAGIVNGTCVGPSHTSAEALAAGESVLAAYAPVNTSLSLLAYYSSPNEGNASYMANTSEWLLRGHY